MVLRAGSSASGFSSVADFVVAVASGAEDWSGAGDGAVWVCGGAGFGGAAFCCSTAEGAEGRSCALWAIPPSRQTARKIKTERSLTRQRGCIAINYRRIYRRTGAVDSAKLG